MSELSFDRPQFEEFLPGDVSELRCKCSYWNITGTPHTLGKIKFEGKYKRGSAGWQDAAFMRWYMHGFLTCYPGWPDGVVLDLSALDYTWGDDIRYGMFPQAWSDQNKPLRIVIPPKDKEPERCKALEWAFGLGYYKLCSDLETAIQEITNLLTAKGK